MKNKILYSVLLVFMLTMFSGCKFLDNEPDDFKTDDMIWFNEDETEAYLYNIYSQIPQANAFQGDPWLGLADEIDLSWNVYPTYNINLGNWNPSTNFYVRWDNFYKAIRASFTFEKNVGRNPELSEEQIVQYTAESKFLRAYYYWLIISQYGPAVLVKDVVELDADWSTYARAPFDDCVDYICKLMDEAEADLPYSWSNNTSWLGKPTKIACRAVKAKALVLAASPQWNGNSAYSSFRNADGSALASTTYDENKWKKAADACAAVIDIADVSGVKLYRNEEDGDGEVNPYKSVRDVMLVNWNKEIIFGRAGFNQNGWQVHCSPSPNNLGGVGPTQRIVDAFYMENGRSIDDPTSGYIETGFATEGGDNWNPDNLDVTEDRATMLSEIRTGDAWGHWPGDWNMFANREPRFYAAILYNKRVIPQLATDLTTRNYYSTVDQQNGYGRVELYFGGMSRGAGSTTFYPRTGYLALKNVDPMSDMRTRTYAGVRSEIKIRYAEILLDYIESLNEYAPGNSDIQKYWDMIRDRAGIPGIFNVYPAIKGDKNQQREYILKERQIELCFEGDRYYTTRRRLLAGTPDTGDDNDVNRKYGDGGRMWGLNINSGIPSGNSFTYTGFYDKTAFETRVFENKMYLFPIPQSEIDEAPNIVQNPGW